MLDIFIESGGHFMSLASDCTIDPEEVEHYEAAASGWWDIRTVARCASPTSGMPPAVTFFAILGSPTAFAN
jgi:hypothetical protein